MRLCERRDKGVPFDDANDPPTFDPLPQIRMTWGRHADRGREARVGGDPYLPVPNGPTAFGAIGRPIGQNRVLAEPVRRSRPSTAGSVVSGVFLFVTFVVYMASGLACVVWGGSSPPDEGDGLEKRSRALCLSSHRREHHAEVRVAVGTPRRTLRLLVRPDVARLCTRCGASPDFAGDGPAITLFLPDVLHSRSIVCSGPETTPIAGGDSSGEGCADVAILERWIDGRLHNVLLPIRFRFGAQYLASLDALQLGFDGEIVLCRGVRYAMSHRQFCAWAPSVDDDGGGFDGAACTDGLSATLHVPLAIQPDDDRPDSDAVLRTDAKSVSDYAPTSVSSVAALWTQCQSAAVVDVFPARAANVAAWTLVDDGSVVALLGSNEPMRQIMEAVSMGGGGCKEAHELRGTASARAVHRTMCASRGVASECDGERAVLALASTSNRRVEIAVAEETACVRLGDSIEDATQPWHESASQSWLRLVLMLLAAAIMWIRRDGAVDSVDATFVECVDATVRSAHRRRLPDDALARASIVVHTTGTVDAQTTLLSLVAVVARLVLGILSLSPMRTDGHLRVSVSEIVGASLSALHWIALYGGGVLPPVRWLRTSGIRPALGGSSALVDITCAIMLSFANPPVRSDISDFGVVGRLLTSVLLTVGCLVRCMLGAACAGLLASLSGAPERAGTAKGPNVVAAASLVALFWIVQSATIAILVADLLATPFAYDLSRTSLGTFEFPAASVYVAVSAAAASRMTANALGIARRVSDLQSESEVKRER